MSHDHGSMDMSGAAEASMGGCKINMLWNWYTIDACFLSESWRITSNGMFAGSCIGVILLVMTLEFFRRVGKEYDRFLVRQAQRSYAASPMTATQQSSTDDITPKNTASNVQITSRPVIPSTFRPNLAQQITRALLHMVQFAIAYFVMLLAMYYNGYFLICIFIGAFLGNFAFNWENLPLGNLGGANGAQEDPTVCCG